MFRWILDEIRDTHRNRLSSNPGGTRKTYFWLKEVVMPKENDRVICLGPMAVKARTETAKHVTAAKNLMVLLITVYCETLKGRDADKRFCQNVFYAMEFAWQMACVCLTFVS